VTNPPAPAGRRTNAAKVLAVFAAIAIIVALLTPEAATNQSGGSSSFSTAPGGTRMTLELAHRMGWRTERRVTPLDTGGAPVVHAVLGPQQTLGAHEVHRLLENVRRGGGLIFTLDGGEEIADSLGITSGQAARFLSGFGDPSCPAARSFQERAALAVPPEVRHIVWRRPAPGPVVPLAQAGIRANEKIPVAVGFPLGRGRVATVSSSGVFANEAVRVCAWGADVAVARALEFTRETSGAPRLVFDEFHHGYGQHPGSIRAVTAYLSGTSSGHFLAQALVAGLLLVLARAPRPIVPREPERIARRSPLEHVDALGQAYADVDATRTATARLLGGVRRRTGRIRARGAGDDGAFLANVRDRFPPLAPSVDIVSNALERPVSARGLIGVGAALSTIEHHLLTTPPPSS
jgi:hypothetical protein